MAQVFGLRNVVSDLDETLRKLQSIQLGGANRRTMRKRDLIFILRNIAILVENGLSLRRSLDTLLQERSLRKHSALLKDLRARLENGEAFSQALAHHPDVFNELMISQIRIGERGGTIPRTLNRLLVQLEHAENLRSQILKKLSYPALLITAGGGAVTFMLLFVVPTFERVYAESGAELPAITQLLIEVGHVATAHGWMLLVALTAVVSVIVATRQTPAGRLWGDAWMIRLPLVGTWLRNIAVLQFIEGLSELMEAGFTLVEALNSCAKVVGNRAIRENIREMHVALSNGERFSTELARRGDMFPPVVNQLVVVGEKTGTLSKTTSHIRAHLRREVETYTNVLVGTIEPIMTIGLAVAIGGILLAIYLPMFDMVNAMNGAH